MSFTLMRSVMKLYLTLLGGVMLATLVVYLVGDFADRLGAYLDKPLSDVAWLYWNKLLIITQQLAPAAMLLAAGATVSTLRKRGEWVAMQSLGLSRAVIVAPIAAVTLLVGGALVAFDEYVVTLAGPTVDHLMAERFNRWGDFRFFYVPRQWFRVDHALVYVRGDALHDGTELHDVTVFELDTAFHVVRRLDAEQLTFVAGSRWLFGSVQSRTFEADGSSQVLAVDRLEVELPGSSKTTFLVRTGRPEYMRLSDLTAQLDIRSKVGLPTARFVLARHNRFAYPVTGFAATMLAVALALRASRRGHLTLALVEGLVVTMSLFGLLLIGKALVLGDHLTPAAAAWSPIAALVAASAAMWWWAERAPKRQ